MPVCSPDVLKVVVSLYHAVESLIYTPPASQLTHTRIQPFSVRTSSAIQHRSSSWTAGWK